MNGHRLPATKRCERCGRDVLMGGHRAKAPVLVCRDCYDADKDYPRMRGVA